jgi:hypothetical protein
LEPSTNDIKAEKPSFADETSDLNVTVIIFSVVIAAGGSVEPQYLQKKKQRKEKSLCRSILKYLFFYRTHLPIFPL